MGDVPATPDPAAEDALSQALAQQALAIDDVDKSLGGHIVDMGNGIVDAIKNLGAKQEESAKTVWGELRKFGDTIGDQIDNVVGLIVDPIRKSLDDLGNDLTKGLDPALGAGLVVGAVYSMRDEITDGFKWLWDHTDVALMEVGDLITTTLEMGWDLIKASWPYIVDGLKKLGEVIVTAGDLVWQYLRDSVVPAIADGLVSLGHFIWDNVPDWMKGIAETLHDIVTWTLSLGADVVGWLSDALEWGFKAVGLDTLGGVMESVSDALHGLADWLGLTTESETAAAERGLEQAAGSREATIADIKSEGTPAFVYNRALEAGATEGEAIHFATIARDTSKSAAMAGVETMAAASEKGMSQREAYKLGVARMGLEVKGFRRGPGEAPGPVSSVAADRAAEIAAAKDTNTTLKRMVALQERAAEKAESGVRTSSEMIDTVSSDDELSAHMTGRTGGGIT